MKSRFLIVTLIFFLAFSCKRKSTDEYEYYHTPTRDTAQTQVVDDPVIEEVEEVVVEEPDRGVDLTNHRYFIVLATYVVEDFAKSQKKELASQGYNPDIFMLNEDGWYRLAVESYKTYDEANERLNTLKEKGGLFSSARIVFKRNTQ